MGRKKRTNKSKQCQANDNQDLENDELEPQVAEIENDARLYTVEQSEIYGRYLKTRVDVKKGTLLLSEKYLVAGPMRSSDIVCVGCHSDLKGGKNKCPKCSWPICKRKCAESAFHKEECKFFVENQVKYPTVLSSTEFGAVTILRGLIMKCQNPEGWKQLLTLEHHNEIRKMLPLWRENELSVVEVIFDILGLEKFFTIEEIHTVCGVFEVNAFELGEKYSFRGVFPEAAMMAHDCIPNTTHFENPKDGIIEVRAGVDIPAGTAITVCYAYSLEATSQRRKMLMDTKFFDCVCQRCNSPSELNTNMGTLTCQACKDGYIMNTGAEDVSQIWTCISCGCRLALASLENLLEKWQMVAEGLEDIKSQEKALATCKSIFHSTHFIPFGIKFNLCQAYGRENIPLLELSSADLNRKLDLCREVMSVLDIITPGYTITRGLVLYEQQAAEVTHARRLYETKKLSKTLLKRKLQNTLKILKESIAILELSHSSTSEYKMSQDAQKDTVVDLTRWINSLK